MGDESDVMNNKINIYWGHKNSHFGMFQMAINEIGCHDLLNFVQNEEELDNYDLWILPIQTAGVWNCGPDESPERHTFKLLDDDAVRVLKKKGAILMLDAAGEGFPIDTNLLKYMNKKLEQFELPAENIIFLTSSIGVQEKYIEWCKSNNELPRFTITKFPVQLYYFAGVYRNQGGINFIDERLTRASKIFTEGKIRNKHFLSLNFMPRPWRYALVLYLKYHNHIDKGFLSFHGPNERWSKVDVGGESIETIAQGIRNLGLGTEYSVKIEELLNQCPIKFGENTGNDRIGYAYNIQDFAPYEESYFSIITESDFFSSGGVRLSEKTYKAFANLHPFILIGPSGALKLAKQEGFKTFSPYIDESYDDIIDDQERLKAVFYEIERLCNMDLNELNQLYSEMFDILLHNFYHFSFGVKTQLLTEEFVKNTTL